MSYRPLLCCLTFMAMLICSSAFANSTLTIEAAGTGVISGRVTKLDGTTAIAGANIKVFQGATLSGTAAADSAGDYTISALDPGSYSVEASSAGYETKTQASVSVSNGTTTTVNFTLAVPINYVYDELGRLVSAIDQNGNAVTYSYDSVGNLLSISRQDQTQAAIIRFSPASGIVGATVTIYGTGFSATAAQNTVTFNGTAATVTQSSMTHIVATVPTGATTGPIAITSPVGSATSSTSFVVGAAPGAPTITSFTPTMGSAGTSVTITGTNFETVSANNKVAFNISHAQVSSATQTSISTTVPALTMSGRVSVATPSGTATSSTDFISLPYPYTASDIETVYRMSIGDTSTFSVNTATKVALVLFDGTAGKRVFFKAASNSINPGAVKIYRPDGVMLDSISGVLASTFYIDTMNLFMNGSYSIIIDPENADTGSMTVTLYDVPADVTGPITIGGSSVGVTITAIGQNARLTFNGTTGQKVSLSISNSTITPCTKSMKNPNGTALGSTAGSFIDLQTLPYTGTYTVLVDPSTVSTGSVTVTLNDAADITGEITIGGSGVPVTISVPGQQARLTFSGTAGQKVSLKGTSSTIVEAAIHIKKPDDSALASISGQLGSSPFLDTQTLPTTGTYTVLIDPQGANTGSLTVNLYDVADVTDTITPGGSAVTASITTPGQNALYTFSGTSGQKVSLKMTNSTIATYSISIKKPDGTTLATTSGTFIDVQTLPTTGTYTVFVSPNGSNTGNITLTLYDVVDYSGTTTVGGGAVAVSLTTPGQIGQLTFSGTASQQVTVRITSNTMSSVTVKLLRPDGTQMTSMTSANGSFNLTQQTLASTGTYTIVIDPSGANTGSMNVSVTSP